MYLDILAYFVLFIVYFLVLVPNFGAFFGVSRSSGYKDDMKLGLQIHGVFICLAAFIFSVLWSIHRLF